MAKVNRVWSRRMGCRKKNSEFSIPVHIAIVSVNALSEEAHTMVPKLGLNLKQRSWMMMDKWDDFSWYTFQHIIRLVIGNSDTDEPSCGPLHFFSFYKVIFNAFDMMWPEGKIPTYSVLAWYTRRLFKNNYTLNKMAIATCLILRLYYLSVGKKWYDACQNANKKVLCYMYMYSDKDKETRPNFLNI